jgi:hypothetical protein
MCVYVYVGLVLFACVIECLCLSVCVYVHTHCVLARLPLLDYALKAAVLKKNGMMI